MIDITQVIVALVGLLATVLTVVAIPWVRAKVGEKRWAQLGPIVTVAVSAAEQLGVTKVLKKGEEKLAYALARAKEALASHGISYDDETIKAAIEDAVRKL